MTLREKIADWISGGALTHLKQGLDGWESLYRIEVEKQIKAANEEDRLFNLCMTAEVKLIKKDQYLRDIAAQETPGANATVKRMARIAREGLGE